MDRSKALRIPVGESPLATFAVVGVAYAALSLSAFQLFGADSIGVTFFPPAGLTLACLLLLPRRMWPAVAAAIVAAELSVDLGHHQGLGSSLGWAAANLVEPLVGATVVLALTPVLRFSRSFVLAFLIGALGAGPAVGASIGGVVIAAGTGSSWFDAFPDVWIGDALGVLVVAPLILVFARRADFVQRQTSTADAVTVGLVTAAVTLLLVLAEDLPLGYAAIVLLAVPAARYSAREVAIAGAVVAAVLTAATAQGRGPWATLSDAGAHAELVQQQAFLLVALGSTWFLKLEVVERARAVASAQTSELELVIEREHTRDQRHLEAMHLALTSLSSSSTAADVLAQVGRHAADVFEATGSVVAIVDDGGELVVRAAEGRWFGDVVPGGSVPLTTPDPLAIAVLSGRLAMADRSRGRPDGPGATAATPAAVPARGASDELARADHFLGLPLPIVSGNGALGLTRTDPDVWSERSQIRALAFASMVADALDRAERYDAERSVASTLQRAIVPHQLRTISGTRAAGRYLPAAARLEVGGDWYDLIPDEERHAATLLIGDVAGHGLVAAAAMGTLAAAGRALGYAAFGPRRLIETLDALSSHDGDPIMTTMACVRVDLQRCELRYAVAGHPPPLLRLPDGGVVRLDDAGSPPLGLRLPGPRPEAEHAAPPGSTVLVYTDGLVERRDRPLEERLHELEAVLARVDATDPELVCAAVLEAMLGGPTHEDDVAVACLTLAP